MTHKLAETEPVRRYLDLVDQLTARHPESKQELDELGDIWPLIVEKAQEEAVRLHGRQILEAIAGTSFDPFEDPSPATRFERQHAIDELIGAGR